MSKKIPILVYVEPRYIEVMRAHSRKLGCRRSSGSASTGMRVLSKRMALIDCPQLRNVEGIDWSE